MWVTSFKVLHLYFTYYLQKLFWITIDFTSLVESIWLFEQCGFTLYEQSPVKKGILAEPTQAYDMEGGIEPTVAYDCVEESEKVE